MKAFKEAEAVVLQKPIKVRVTCPYCDYENEIDYIDFCCEYGEPPDWDYEKICCQECGGIIEIQGQDWY